MKKERIKIKREMEALELKLQLIEYQKRMDELAEEETRNKMRK